jgi:hypothetical protein
MKYEELGSVETINYLTLSNSSYFIVAGTKS